MSDLEAALEALLFLTDEPLPVDELARVVERDDADVLDALERLAADYERSGRGLAVRRAAGGWRMYSAPRVQEVVERWVLEGRTGTLTPAAVETLAVIAYKQPITRGRIGEIRGVNPDAAVRSLERRGFIREVGRADAPGQPVLYGTTTQFLEQLGLDDLDGLPRLTDYLLDDAAPDEPEVGGQRAARERIAAGGWPERAAETRAEMAALTETLDRAARSAMERLRQVEQATAAPADPADGDDAAKHGPASA